MLQTHLLSHDLYILNELMEEDQQCEKRGKIKENGSIIEREVRRRRLLIVSEGDSNH